MKHVIFDTDVGIDDAMALLFLHAHPNVTLTAITTTFGNASIEATTRNALYVCQRFGIKVPVFKGLGQAMGPSILEGYADFVHGKNGLGDIELKEPKIGEETEPAAQALVRLIRERPGEISVVAVGRMTNLAAALRLEPQLPGLVKEVIVMGGAFGFNGHAGNVSPVAEANIAGDPLAADTVFSAGFPLTIVGLDVTQEVILDEKFFLTLRNNGGDMGEFIYDISRFYLQFHLDTTGEFTCPVHDSSAVAFLLAPDLFVTRRAKVRVATEGIASGQTIHSQFHQKWPVDYWESASDSQICVQVDAKGLKSLYLKTLSAS